MKGTQMDYTVEANKVAEWMKNYLENSGCKGYVVGISGGIDSAFCLSLCHKITKNIIAVSLPCHSSFDMNKDAIDLANNFNIELRVFNLVDSYNSIIDDLENGGETVDNLTQANIKARLRMTYLFAIANQYNYLVAGTGNKSELDIGYVTYGGDSVVSCEPFGNYYKTEIYEMAKLIPEIPENILNKKPSADLWTGQSDEDEIGMTYLVLDTILKALEVEDKGALACIDAQKVDKVKKMIKRAEYKNRLPLRYIRK